MSDYGFFIAHLRFVAARTAASDPGIAAMVGELGRIADAVEKAGAFSVPNGQLRVAARGFAGMAGFLQERILPEAVAAGNRAGEREVRWVIDTSMGLVTALTTHAEAAATEESLVLSLPPPPAAA